MINVGLAQAHPNNFNVLTQNIIVQIGKFTAHFITLLFKTGRCAMHTHTCTLQTYQVSLLVLMWDTHVLSYYAVIISLEIALQTYTTYSDV